MQIKMVKTADIIPYENNAKKHPDDQIDHIANSIKRFGWRQPIVVDKENIIIAGHGRLLAAQKLGSETVPALYVDDLTDEEIKALRLADNKTNESGWDDDLLALELEGLKNLNMEDFGFEKELEMSFNKEELDSLFMDSEEKEKQPKVIKCPHCGEMIEI